jgi:hypothetical protein
MRGDRHEFKIDVSGLIPEAQPVVLQAAEVFIRHTRPWFIGLACFGSAVKGWFLPGFSDIDFHLYLEDAAFTNLEELSLPVKLCLAIQRDLARVDPAPFAYIDGGAERAYIPPGHVGPVPGNTWLVAGRMPVSQATPAELVAEARASLAQLEVQPVFLTPGLLHTGQSHGDLALTVRSLTQAVWPTLFQALVLMRPDPMLVWATPKDQAIRLLPVDSPIGQAAQVFWASLLNYHQSMAKAGGNEAIEPALAVIQDGVAFLESAKAWYEASSYVLADPNPAEGTTKY